MFFSSRARSADLTIVCRTIRNGTESGLTLVRVFEQLAGRGPLRCRALAGRVHERLNQGDSLGDSLDPEADRLPDLFLSLARVGEDTGNLAETFRELEDFYEQQTTLIRQFRSALIFPVLEFVAAIGILCLLLMIVGFLNLTIDPLGIGVGFKGVARLLLIVGFWLTLIYFIYWFLSRHLRFMAPVERVILAMPVIGPALESVLMTRFCLGLQLTTGAGLPTPKALEKSLSASASALYQRSYQKAKPGLRRGEELTEVLTRCAVFPPDFLDIVSNAEEGGRVPEVMARQSLYYRLEASRRLKSLSTMASTFVIFAVIILLVFLIARLYMQVVGPAYKMATDMMP